MASKQQQTAAEWKLIGGADSHLYVGDVRGELWASNSYFACPLARFPRIAAMIGHNPGAYVLHAVGNIEALFNTMTPNIAAVVPTTTKELRPVEPIIYDRTGARIYNEHGAELWLNGNHVFGINVDYAEACGIRSADRNHALGEIMQAKGKHLTPICRVEHGKVTAVLMPVRVGK